MRHIKFSLFTLLTLLSVLPSLAQDFEYDGIWYTVIDDDGHTCKTKNGNDIGPGNTVEGNIEIPQTVSNEAYDFTVVEIGEKSFYGCDNLISIKLPATVEYIRESAFQNCSALTSIDMPENLLEIKNLAFAECESLEAISFADSVHELGFNTFASCKSLTSIVLPASLKNIGESTFKDCSGLVSVIFPEGFESIGFWGFWNCTSLKSLDFPDSMLSVGELAFQDCSALESITFGNSLQTIANHAFIGCSSLQSIELPASLTSIGSTAFSDCSSMTTAVFKGNPQVIDMGLFTNCSSLVNVTLPTDLQVVKAAMFENCSSLASLQLPSTVTQIEESAFKGCSQLASLDMPSNLRSIGDNGFNGCNALESISLPMSLATLGQEAFADCIGLKSVDFLSLETEIGTNAFINCSSLQSVNLPSSLLTIERGTFADCSSLSSINFPETLTKIGDSAFIRCGSLENLEFPEALTHIEAYAFNECIGLKSVSFPAGLELMPPFTNCNNIIEVNYSATTPLETDNGFENPVYENATLNMPNATLEAIQATEPWRNFKHIIASDGSIGQTLAVGDKFEYDGMIYVVTNSNERTCKTMVGSEDTQTPGNNIVGDLVIPEKAYAGGVEYTVTEIGYCGFFKAFDLTSVVVPPTITAIPQGGFACCYALTNVTLPESIKSIGMSGFNACRTLEKIDIPEGVNYIDRWAFGDCWKLLEISLPSTLESMEEYVFQYDRQITTVNYAAEKPIVAEGLIFEQEAFDNATLNMPNATLADIQATTPWNLFKHIVAKDGSVSPDLAAGEDFEYNGIWYTVLDAEAKTCKTKDGIGDNLLDWSNSEHSYGNVIQGTFTLPSTVSYNDADYTVVEIGNNGFCYSTELESISLPETITKIGDYAFLGCSSLTSINLPESLSSIGVRGFHGCGSMTTLTLPSHLSTIGESAFESCTSLTSINIPESLTSIENNLFLSCSALASIDIPESVTSIGEGSFFACSSLETIKLPASLTTLKKEAFSRCNENGTITYLAETPLSTSEFEVFSSSTYERKILKMPNATLEAIQATEPWLNFKHIEAKDGSIGSELAAGEDFEYEGIWYTVIDAEAKTCRTKSGSVENDTYVAGNAVNGEITIPETVSDGNNDYIVAEIGWVGFANCTDLTSITLPSTVTSIPESAFNGCANMTTVNLPNTLTSISVNAFLGCEKLSGITLPESLNSVGHGAFTGCASITSIVIPEVLTILKNQVFSGCSSLKSIELPATLEGIEYGAFFGCDPNVEVTYNATTPIAADENAFSENAYASGTLNTPNATLESVQSTVPWNMFKHIVASDGAIGGELAAGEDFVYNGMTYTVIDAEAKTCKTKVNWYATTEGISSDMFTDNFEIPSKASDGNYDYTVIGIGAHTFDNCEPLSAIKLPDTLTSIDPYAFYGCRNLTSVNIPASVVSIGTWAFAENEALTSVSIPESIETIDEGAFRGCTALTTVSLPSSLKTLPVAMFHSCTSLSSVNFPESLVSIGDQAFYYCEALTSVILPESLKTIGNSAFSTCNHLSKLELPVSLLEIGDKAFWGCDLTSLTLPAALTSIGESAFERCEKIRTVNYNASSLISAPESIFDTEIVNIYDVATLNTPNATLEAVQATVPWNKFLHITASDGSIEPDVNVESITLSLSSAQLKVGESFTLSATVLPEDATDKTITWTSSNHEIATVDTDGVVTAIAIGEATITATCGEATASCSVSVVQTPVDSITLNLSSAQLKVGESFTLSATVLPEDATDKTITWTSSNPEIATVDAEGSVTAIAIGEATITASCGEASASCSVSVVQTPVESITLSLSSAELQVGESIALSVTILPEDASDKSITWSSSNSAIATVDSEGLVTAIAAGEATITASCGEVTATCSVKVVSNALSAGEDFEYEGVIYTVIDADAMTCRTKAGHYEDQTLIPGNNFEGDLIIPATAIYSDFEYTVVEIGRYGFGFNAGLTSVIIPETITNIPESAFENCTNLTSASIPQSVTSIGIYAFDECERLKSVDLPKSLEKMGYAAFSNCSNISSVVIPESLTVLENHVFSSCDNLMTIDIPANITQIDNYAFNGCNSNAEITYRAEVPVETIDNIFDDATYQSGTLFTPNATLETVQAVTPWNKFLRISASDASTFIPNVGDSFSFEGIVYTVIDADNHILKTADGSEQGIGSNNCEGDIVIPSSVEAFDTTYDVTEIGAYSFSGSEYLTSVTIPASIENFGESAFSDCERLTSIIWQGNHPLQSDVIEAIGNPNLLIYVDSIQFAPAGFDHNIVVLQTNDGVPSCDNMVLLQGYAFRPAIDFISQNSSLTQDYTQATIIGECAGWETIVLPFDVKSIYNEKCGELTPFAALTDIEIQNPFWLYEADAQGEWKEADGIHAGIPYIISMPNNPDYLDRFNIDGPVRFESSEAAKITKEIASPYAVNWNSGQAFSSMWLPLDDSQAANAMGLNVGIDGLTDDDGSELLPGSAFCEGVTPRPLEAYFTRQGAESAKRIIGTLTGVRTVDSINGLEIKAYIGKIMITSDSDRKIDIFAIDGTHIRTLFVKAGSTETVRDLTKGLYLVAGQKILVK